LQVTRPSVVHEVSTHTPSTQRGLLRLPLSHELPHVPQLKKSFFGLVQVPPHWVRPGRHAHAPVMQAWVAPHAWPQVPQLVGELWRFAHSVGLHCMPPQEHWLFTHASPTAQALLQAPQFSGSVTVDVHAVPHWTPPGPHAH
jgi:hypothetical protein